MLRIRLDGGFLDRDMGLNLIKIAKEFNLKLLITTRAGLELHNILPSDILKIYYKIKKLGFNTHQSLTDNVRAIVTDVYDGLTIDSKIECAPIIEKIKQEFLDKKEFFGTIPRKFNTAIIGSVAPMLNHWGNDLLFALAKKGSKYGFNIYLGGKNSEVAKDANIFVTPNDVPRLFKSVLLSFNELGFRGSRSKTRLFYLLEEIGTKKFKYTISKHFGTNLESKGTLLMQNSRYKVETKLKDGLIAKVYSCNWGEVDLNILQTLLKSYKIRVGADQNIHIIGAKESISSDIKAPIKACAGSRYCPLSLWDIKQDIEILGLKQFSQLGISVGFSGCLKGCGHHLLSDIGLVGLRTNLYGPTQKALRVYFGATELPKPTPARLLYFAVPLSKIESLFKAFKELFLQSGYSSFREFSTYLQKYSIESLQLLFLLEAMDEFKSKEILFDKNTTNEILIKALVNKEPSSEELHKIINKLAHKLWDD